MTVTNDLTKQPRWVQDLVERLTRDVEHWRERAEGREGGVSHVWLWSGAGKGGYNALHDGARVSFAVLGDPHDHGHRFDVSLRGDELRVSGGDGLMLRPIASNAFAVTHDWRR